jgi:hypothetical protein
MGGGSWPLGREEGRRLDGGEVCSGGAVVAIG